VRHHRGPRRRNLRHDPGGAQSLRPQKEPVGRRRPHRRHRRLWLEQEEELEQQFKLRLQELDEKELGLDRREASFIAEHEIREQRLEDREREGQDRDVRLDQRETHLQTYVGQLQNQFANEGDWWAKQLGADEKVSAA